MSALKCRRCGEDMKLEKVEAVMSPGIPTLNLKTYKCPKGCKQ